MENEMINSTGRKFNIQTSRIETYEAKGYMEYTIDEDDSEVIWEETWQRWKGEGLDGLTQEEAIATPEWKTLYQEVLEAHIQEVMDWDDIDWELEDCADIQDSEVDGMAEDTSLAVLLNQPGHHNTDKLVQALLKEVA